MVERETEIFPTNAIDKADLIWCRPDLAAQIQALKADDLQQMAFAIGEILQDEFWSAVHLVLSRYFAEETNDDEVDENDTGDATNHDSIHS